MRGAGALLFAVLASGCQASAVANPQAAALNLELGASYMSQGRLELARDKLTRATRQDPGSSEAHRVLGMVFEGLNDAPAPRITTGRRCVWRPGTLKL